jgi:uncharacterized cupin superfamily protein
VEVTPIAEGQTPYLREGAAGEPEVGQPSPRPATVVNLADVTERDERHGDCALGERDLGRAAGSVGTGISYVTIPAGHIGWPPHCHSAEEEIFVVLAGEGAVVLGDEQHAVRPGHVVGRPPGTRVPHSFRAGEDGISYLAYGTRVPNDICYYPRSGKVSLRGVGVIGRIEPLDYWDGEPG